MKLLNNMLYLLSSIYHALLFLNSHDPAPSLHDKSSKNFLIRKEFDHVHNPPRLATIDHQNDYMHFSMFIGYITFQITKCYTNRVN